MRGRVLVLPLLLLVLLFGAPLPGAAAAEAQPIRCASDVNCTDLTTRCVGANATSLGVCVRVRRVTVG